MPNTTYTNCLHCGELTLNPKFCCRSCSAIVGNTGRIPSYETRLKTSKSLTKSDITKPKPKPKIICLITNCLYCNNELQRGRYGKKYCDVTCHANHKQQTKFLQMESGEIPYNKKYLLNELSNQCQECGITEWNNKPITIELEHIDGDSTNNTSENLTLLCPNCHSQTPTYKGRNKGNGRHSRKMRYKEGKSY